MNMPRNAGVAVFFCVALVAAVAAFFYNPAAAQRQTFTRYEYASISGSYFPYTTENSAIVATAAVNICYFQATGCQNEEIRAEVNYSRYFQETRFENNEQSRSYVETRAAETAFAKAIAKLGQEGWEMVSTPALEFDNYVQTSPSNYRVQEGSKQRKPDIFFKRAR
jgi:hypothetical protein